MVKLRSADWTQVTQDVRAKIGKYNVDITYVPSSDLKFSDRKEDYTNIPAHLGYTALSQFSSGPAFGRSSSTISAPVTTGTGRSSRSLGCPGTQTLHMHVQLDSGADAEKGFILIFPPGHGYVNLLKLSMTPISAAAPVSTSGN